MQKQFWSARWALCLLLVLLSGCAWLGAGGGDIVAPQADDRGFRYVQLDNGLRVLLISDADADKAAASLDVAVGSRHDPQGRFGLAHFLEHMLFLGTAKYPDAGEYQSFIASRGGSHNAYTSFEHTNYFFDISADALEPALDRFAQFFVAPLFNAEYVGREVNAVESEYRARINSDQRRVLDVLKEQANPVHPFAKFTVGSLATLLGGRSEQALREDLLNFYQRYYVAERMTLVVQGRESLRKLENMVTSRFSGVVSGPINQTPITAALFEQTPRWIDIRPQQELRELTVSFQIPDVGGLYRSKPYNYIGNLLGHEGKGSLLSMLKRRGWAEALSVGQGYEYQGGGIFNVQIHLTEAGIEHADEVIASLFDTIALVRERGIDEWRYREQQLLGEQQFRFRTRPEVIHEVTQLSRDLHQYAVPDVLRGPYMMENYDAAVIRRMLDFLTVDNSLVTLTVPGLDGDYESEFYQTPYSLRRVPEVVLERWRTPQINGELALPEANVFIARNLNLHESAGKSEHPQALKASEAVELWFQHDDEYELPKGSIRLLLESNTAGSTVEQRAMSELWERMVEEQLNEFVYPAQLAGLSFSIAAGWQGMELTVHGFDDRQALLLEELAVALGSPEFDAARFERVKAQLIRRLENRREREPYRQLAAELPRVMHRYQWSLDAQIAAAQAATLDALRAHVQQVMSGASLRMLVYGNYEAAEAQQFADIAARYLRGERAHEPLPEAIVQLQPGQQLRELPSEHADASLLLYLQAPEVSKHQRVVMGVAGQMLHSEFFDQLRTEMQLGYVVSASVYPMREVPGLIFLVQSPVADSLRLQREFQGFLQRWLAREDLAAHFERHKRSLIARLEEEPRNLWEAGDRYWSDLLDGYRGFDSREQLLAALRPMDFERWQTDLQQALQEQRALWLYSRGKWQEQPQGQRIDDLRRFKASQQYYDFP